MKIKKITALAVGAAMLGAVLAGGTVAAQRIDAPSGIPKLNISNTEVVLPTVPEINGVPLAIKNDAASAVLLISDIYQDSVLMDIQLVQESLEPLDANGQLSNKIADNDETVSITTGEGDGNSSNADIDIDGHWYLPNIDIPIDDLSNIDVDTTGKVGFGVDFNKIEQVPTGQNDTVYPEEEAHRGEWRLEDGAIQIAWALDWSPLKPSANDDVVLSNSDGKDVIYYYKNFTPEQELVQVPVGGSAGIDGWHVIPIDIENTSSQQKTIKIMVTHDGYDGEEVYAKVDENNEYHYIFWVDENGKIVHWSDDPDDDTKTLDIDDDGENDLSEDASADDVVKTLERNGIGTIFIIEPKRTFVGINSTQEVEFGMEAKELKNIYTQGEKAINILPELKNYPHAENWYLDIENVTDTDGDGVADSAVVKFVWKSVYNPDDDEYSDFPPVFFKPGDKLYIPIPYFDEDGNLKVEAVSLEMDAETNGSGKYYDKDTARFYIEYYQHMDKYYKQDDVDGKLTELMNKVQASDPTNALVTDVEVVSNGFEAGKDYVIIGGWVSNKAWEELEKYYPEKVAEMKNYLFDQVQKGQPDYIVYVLPNPADSDHVIIVAAGTDHEQTAEAVKYIISHMGA